jgi:hypothetical protein
VLNLPALSYAIYVLISDLSHCRVRQTQGVADLLVFNAPLHMLNNIIEIEFAGLAPVLREPPMLPIVKKMLGGAGFHGLIVGVLVEV